MCYSHYFSNITISTLSRAPFIRPFHFHILRSRYQLHKRVQNTRVTVSVKWQTHAVFRYLTLAREWQRRVWNAVGRHRNKNDEKDMFQSFNNKKRRVECWKVTRVHVLTGQLHFPHSPNKLFTKKDSRMRYDFVENENKVKSIKTLGWSFINPNILPCFLCQFYVKTRNNSHFHIFLYFLFFFTLNIF